MKNFLIYSFLLYLILISCINKEVSIYSKKDNKMDSIIYSDVDLFTFQGVETKKFKDKYIKMQNFNNKIIIVVFANNKSFESVYKKNSDGYFFQIEEINEGGFIEIVYTIYSEQKIVKFFLSKFKGDKDMMLNSHRIILPLDSENKQREITYKYEEIMIKDFNKIEYLGIIKGKIKDNFEYESYYNFDFNNQECTYGMIENDRFIVGNIFEIGNSISIASPLYRFWTIR